MKVVSKTGNAAVAEVRTTTAADDWVTRAIGPMPMNAVLLLAGAVYAGLGLVVPLSVGANTSWLICCNIIGASLGWLITLAWLFPRVEARLRRQLLEQTTELRLLSAAEFELLVGELLRREGWSVTETGREGEADGNVDLRIRLDGRERLVQCKRWDSRLVGVGEVRKLGGALLREGLSGEAGLLVTSGAFTPAAIAEAREIGIELVARHELLRRLDVVGATELLKRNKVATEAYLCPKCSSPMLLDRSRYGWWLHCPSYYDGCGGKQDLGTDSRRALELILASA